MSWIDCHRGLLATLLFGAASWLCGCNATAVSDAAEPSAAAAFSAAVQDEVSAALLQGRLAPSEVRSELARLAGSEDAAQAGVPARLLQRWLSHYGDEPKIGAALRNTARELYPADDLARAFDPAFYATLSGAEATALHRQRVGLHALVLADADVRGAALAAVLGAVSEEGIAAATLAAPTRQTALTVAVQDGDAQLRKYLLNAFLRSDNPRFRAQALHALGRARDPALADELRERAVAGQLRAGEAAALFDAQVEDATSRIGAWRFVRERAGELVAAIPASEAARLPHAFATFCDEAMVPLVRDTFAPHVAALPDGPRELEAALESLQSCAARAAKERSLVRAAFAPGVRR